MVALGREVREMQTLTFPKTDVAKVTSEEVANLAKRLEEDDYNDAFACLSDWHLLRAIALNNPDLAEPYRYLLDIEAFDEA